jgi:hypothetical protein
MQRITLTSNALANQRRYGYWLHLEAYEQTIASISLSADGGPFKRLWKVGRGPLSQRFPDSSSN